MYTHIRYTWIQFLIFSLHKVRSRREVVFVFYYGDLGLQMTIWLKINFCNISIKSGQSILIYFTYVQNIIISKVGTTQNFPT